MSVVINGVRLDKLLAMEPDSVVDAVPISEHDNYTYWRGLHLGKVALNLLRGRFFINAGESDTTIHFIDSRDIAQGYARSEARLKNRFSALTQWNPADEQRFKEITALSVPDHFAGAVVAYRHHGYLPRATQGVGHGYAINATVSFNDIDPYSREALEDLFEMDLTNVNKGIATKPIGYLSKLAKPTLPISPDSMIRLLKPD